MNKFSLLLGNFELLWSLKLNFLVIFKLLKQIFCYKSTFGYVQHLDYQKFKKTQSSGPFYKAKRLENVQSFFSVKVPPTFGAKIL